MIDRLVPVVAVAIWLTAATFSASASDAISLGPDAKKAEHRIEAARKRQRSQLEAIKKQFRESPIPPDPAEGEPSHVTERRERYRELEKKLAEIERRIQFEERTGVMWNRAVDPRVRDYYDKLLKRIEARGNADFPMEDGKSLYGRVRVTFTVLSQGHIESIEVSESTSEKLSAHTLRTLKAAAPFDAFSPALAKKFDRLEITVPFTYSKD